MEKQAIINDLKNILDDYFNQVSLKKGSVFVLGCSTSEILGKWKGTDSSLSTGKTVVETIQSYLQPRELNLAIQGCEHINRSLLMERSVAEQNDYEQVTVVPAMHAGGGTQVAGYQLFQEPVEVRRITAVGGLDIGGTEIGMHVKFVQIPVQLRTRHVGKADVVALSSRPELVGGTRAKYTFSEENLKDVW